MFLTIKRCLKGTPSKIVLFVSQKRYPRTNLEIRSLKEAKWKDVYFSEEVNGEETFFYGGKDLSADPLKLIEHDWETYTEKAIAHAGNFATMAEVAKKLIKRKKTGEYMEHFDIYIAVILPAIMSTEVPEVRSRMITELAGMLNKKRKELKLVRKSPFMRPKRRQTCVILTHS